MDVFTPADRERLRSSLVAEAREDARIQALALTGSASLGREDRWSDIDIALRIDGAVMDDVLDDWTRRFYGNHGAVAHVDVWRGATRFRVFLLENTLQVDVAFWHAEEFGATGPTFKLVFGSANERPVQPAEASDLIGMAWLYALHVRSSIARKHLWQAEYMLSAMRDHVLALACWRHGLPTRDGRGFDDLPDDVKARLESTLVSALDADALRIAFTTVTDVFLTEIALVDKDLGERLEAPLRILPR